MSGPGRLDELIAEARRIDMEARRLEIEAAADAAFDANPGSPLPPELAARFRRVLPPPPGEAQAA